MSVTTVTIGGKTVTVTEDKTPNRIWRGDNPDGSRRQVAELPASGWIYTVSGMMSGSAPTRDAAFARAEHYVRSGDKRGLRPRFRLTREQADAVLDQEYQAHADLLAAYPFEMDPTTNLSTKTFLEGIAARRDQDRDVLMGIVGSPVWDHRPA